MHESDHGHVIIWDGVSNNITSNGYVTIKFDSGFVHTLRDVRYIPHIGGNLISLRKLGRSGFIDVLGDGMIMMFEDI